MMLGAYDWAFVKPMRKLYYNMTITLVSVVVAVFVGGIEVLGLVSTKFSLEGSFWKLVRGLNENFHNLGFVIVGIFLASWLLSFLIYRAKNLDELEL